MQNWWWTATYHCMFHASVPKFWSAAVDQNLRVNLPCWSFFQFIKPYVFVPGRGHPMFSAGKRWKNAPSLHSLWLWFTDWLGATKILTCIYLVMNDLFNGYHMIYIYIYIVNRHMIMIATLVFIICHVYTIYTAYIYICLKWNRL